MKVFAAGVFVPAHTDQADKHKFTEARKHSFRPYEMFGKRLFDLCLACLLLVIIAPVIGVLWALARLDGGPGFYSQERVGLHGTRFKCWKLRTMVVDAETVLRELCEKDPLVAAEWYQNQKLAKDPRITAVGRFLRATSLDELPQIWNVLRGEMSFVGPRPFMVSQEHLYIAAGGKAYFLVRPGITGPWQVAGRSETTFVQRIRYDNLYWKQLSLRADLWYLWKTVGAVCSKTGA